MSNKRYFQKSCRYRLINEEFPAVSSSNPVAKHPFINDRIFILSSDQDAYEKATQSLAEMGYQGEFLSEHLIQEGKIQYNMILLKVRPLDAVSLKSK